LARSFEFSRLVSEEFTGRKESLVND